MVRNRQLHVATGREYLIEFGADQIILQGNVDDAAVLHGLHGVDYDVLNNLADLALVNIGRPEITRDVKLAPRVRTAQGKLSDFANHVRQNHRCADGCATLGEGEQLLRKIPGAYDRLLRVAQRAGGLRFHFGVQAREREIAHDDGQQVVEIVREAAGQQPERLEFAGAQQFGLQLRLALQLLANLLGLRTHAASERGNPDDEQQDTHGQRAREAENPSAC